jgi:hypothetical protein
MEDLPDPKWVWLERPHHCSQCSEEIEAGRKGYVFPATGGIYCWKCSRLFVGKLKTGGGRYKGEFMPPPGRD